MRTPPWCDRGLRNAISISTIPYNRYEWSGVEWRGAGVTRECTWSGTIPRMNLIVTALNANFNSVSSVTGFSIGKS